MALHTGQFVAVIIALVVTVLFCVPYATNEIATFWKHRIDAVNKGQAPGVILLTSRIALVYMLSWVKKYVLNCMHV